MPINKVKMRHEDFLKTLKERVDIVEFVSRYVQLKKSGKNYKARCPFHPDKNPSFVVNPQLQRYRCFGCGASGDIVDFLMRIEGITFKEAVEILAKEAGLEVPYGSLKSHTARVDALYAVVEEAKELYREALKDSEDALEYLFSRGLKLEDIEFWEIGYAPGGDYLKQKLLERGYREEDIKEAGLLTGAGVDFFQDRIVIPIKNSAGKVVSFGGRVLPGADPELPKYINTPNTPIYDKSSVLFGLNVALAKRDGGKLPSVVLMEGYFDVILSHAKEVPNPVATSGTAFTQKHARLLKRYTERVSILYDGDEAGMKGAIKAGAVLLEAGFPEEETVLVFLPPGVDPADYFITHSLEEFASDESIKKFTLTEALIHFLDSKSISDGMKIYEASSLLSSIEDAVLKFDLMKKVAEHYDFPVSALPGVIRKTSYAHARVYKENLENGSRNSFSPQLLLATIIDGREKLRIKFLETVSGWDLDLPSGEEDLILFRVAEGERLSDVISDFPEEYEKRLMRVDYDEERVELAFEDAMNYFYRKVVQYNLDLLKEKAREIKKSGGDVSDIAEKITELKKKLLSFSI